MNAVQIYVRHIFRSRWGQAISLIFKQWELMARSNWWRLWIKGRAENWELTSVLRSLDWQLYYKWRIIGACEDDYFSFLTSASFYSFFFFLVGGHLLSLLIAFPEYVKFSNFLEYICSFSFLVYCYFNLYLFLSAFLNFFLYVFLFSLYAFFWNACFFPDRFIFLHFLYYFLNIRIFLTSMVIFFFISFRILF